MISFTKGEAGRLGSPTFETEYFLLAMLRYGSLNFKIFRPSADSRETSCSQIERRAIAGRGALPTGEAIDPSDLPLSGEFNPVQAYAAEEASLAGTRIGAEHLLLGLLREESCLAAHLLREAGAKIERIRRNLALEGKGV